MNEIKIRKNISPNDEIFLLSGHLTFSLRTLVEHDDASVQPVYDKEKMSRQEIISNVRWKLFHFFFFNAMR